MHESAQIREFGAMHEISINFSFPNVQILVINDHLSMQRFFLLLSPILMISCQVKPYAPLPQQARVESVEVEVRSFEGRPEAYAIVKGHLSTSAAQLVDPRQSRVERSLMIEVLEQTPRGANLLPDLTAAPPFETRVPIEILGLEPGPCLLYVNGIATSFEVPSLHATLAAPVSAAAPHPAAVTLVDEFIPIEEAVPGMAVTPRPVQSGSFPAPVATPVYSEAEGNSF